MYDVPLGLRVTITSSLRETTILASNYRLASLTLNSYFNGIRYSLFLASSVHHHTCDVHPCCYVQFLLNHSHLLYLVVQIYYNLLFILLVGYLGCFHFLAIMNTAAVNNLVYVFQYTYVNISSGYRNRSRTA